MSTDEWLTSAEDCVERAAQSILSGSAADLEEAHTHLSKARTDIPLDEEVLLRLDTLREKLTALHARARLGFAFHVGLDQLDQRSIIGYSPTGLERAL